MTANQAWIKYIFKEHSGWIVDPRLESEPHNLLGIGHTACIEPWRDPDLHQHQESEEFYLLLQGELWLWIAGARVTLQPRELLMVRPRVAHAVLGGQGKIEHFGLRAPCLEDRHPTGKIPDLLPPTGPVEREFRADWGCRIPLSRAENHNRWLLGTGMAKYASQHIICAYLNFPTEQAANAGIGTRLRRHYHQRSWEYYTVLQGCKVLEIGDELVNVEAGEIVAVLPGVWHNIHHRQAPFEGFTLRVPVLDENDKVEEEL